MTHHIPFFDRLIHEMWHYQIAPQRDGSISAFDVTKKGWKKFKSIEECYNFLNSLLCANISIKEKTWQTIRHIFADILGRVKPEFISNGEKISYRLRELVSFSQKDQQSDIEELTQNFIDEISDSKNGVFAKQSDIDALQKYIIRLQNNFMAIDRVKYRIILLLAFHEEIEEKKQMRTAGSLFGPGYYSSTKDNVDGPYNRLDLPELERVYPFDGPYGVADGLENRDKAIKNQPRYNPEHSRNGIYFEIRELSWEPTTWDKVMKGDSPYKIRSLLMRD